MAEKFQVLSDWHAEDVKAAVRKRGKSLSQLSRDSGLQADTLRNVFRIRCKKYESIIGDFLGVQPSVIWPSRYEAKRHE
ncbi:TPA: helix-turn-helix domain-containing protein [Escherichia coli]|nr:helix-turn-helix domain-containing protein [Escherichia coli]